jgi:hypothetical protein
MEQQNGQVQSQTEQKKKKPSTAMKITVLVILIVLLAAGILLPIKLVPNAVSSVASTISSFFIGKQEVKLTTDRSVINSGETFTLSWTGDHKTNGTYSLSYTCTTGLRLETSVNQPNETVACDSTYYFAPNDNKVDLTAFGESTRYTDVVVTLGFLENGASTVDELGKLTITITNPNLMEGTTATPATSTPDTTNEPTTPDDDEDETDVSSATPTPAPSRPVSNPNGTADLEARPIAVGYLTDTGVFVPSASVATNQQIAIKFQIVNVGDKNTGAWNFVADLPSDTDPKFTSATQQNLGPGDRIEFVLGFRNLKNSSNNVVVITADPSNFLTEKTKTNNSIRMNVVNTNSSTTNTSTNTGKADLVVRMLDTGIVNRSTNAYTTSSSANNGDRVGVRFEVENVGGTATGSWRFAATLPASDSNSVNYTSDYQDSLLPGQKKTFTIAFDNLRSVGVNTITVVVDSSNQVNEANENNQASINITRN